MNELIEKNAKLLAVQWDRIPQAGTNALESLLFIRLAEFEEREQKEQLLRRLLQLAEENITGTSADMIKIRSFKRLEDAVESIRCRLARED